jgi:hypothetical protein
MRAWETGSKGGERSQRCLETRGIRGGRGHHWYCILTGEQKIRFLYPMQIHPGRIWRWREGDSKSILMVRGKRKKKKKKEKTSLSPLICSSSLLPIM